MDYQETLDYLFSQLPMYQRIGKAAYKANLANTLALDEYFGHPHTRFKSIHVAGTNGKGSTSHMLASVLQEAGYKVGLYTSPHLKDFRERIRVNGEPISEGEVVDFVAQHREIFEQVQPSFFEMTVVLAFDYFARQQVDIAVVEVGMGGRLDSTNIINPLLSVITNIGLDHTEFLGDTVAKVAGEKAGIIKPAVPVVIGEWNEESAPVFEQKAQAEGSSVVFADKLLSAEYKGFFDGTQCFEVNFPNDFTLKQNVFCLDLMGGYQKKNLLTALTAINSLRADAKLRIGEESVGKGLAKVVQNTGLLGRWQVLSYKPLCICDTGHNAHGLTQSMQQLKAMSYEKLFFVFGVVSDKDLSSILPLLPQDAYYFYTKAKLPRAMDASLLAEKCTAYGLQGEVIEDIPTALAEAKKRAGDNDIVFVGGSTFVVAEAI